MDNIKSTDNILIVWNNDSQKEIPNFVNEIKNIVSNGEVVLENSERLLISTRPQSSFNIIISNWLAPNSVKHTDEVLAFMLKLLRPCGKLMVKDGSDLTSALKLNGFLNINKSENNVYVAEKPNFEVGSKAALKLGNNPTVWKLDDTVEAAWTVNNDDDIIDDNQLLDDNDLKMPDKESLRVCATTGKRKACADCSCGLAEELRGEIKETPKSSCGSCYLGDAFRCATCPYLGMPAFKPGEKIVLENNDDI